MGDQLPALSYQFGIRPADVDDMTVTEVGHYLAAIKQLNDAVDRR